MNINNLRKAKVTQKGVHRLSLPKGTIVFFDEPSGMNNIYNTVGEWIFGTVEVATKDMEFFDSSLMEVLGDMPKE